MKRALVIGITGGFGGHTARALLANGWQVKALMREPTKLPRHLSPVQAIQGDARDESAVRQAAAGVDALVFGANLPYPRWHREAMALLEPSVRVAEAKGLTLLFPGNVYIYDPADGDEFHEHAPARPITRKGQIRQRMETRLRTASANGARILLIRAGDFIGAHTDSSWIKVLTKRTHRGYRLLLPGPIDLPHTWANLPDVAETAARLLNERERLPAYADFHFAGYRITFRELASAMAEASGQPVTSRTFPWWALRLASPFVPFFRELLEMRYLWEREVHLDGRRLQAQLGQRMPHTALADALRQAGVVEHEDERIAAV